MHYLVTGHTGFKGAWLSLLLQMQGHTISGISLDPLEKSLFTQANLGEIFKNDLRSDVRNSGELSRLIQKIQPDVIVHLAAQSLVRESYKNPIETFNTNVLGTLNLLESTKTLSNLQAVLIITTDKVYKNGNHLRGYVETDELGGDDPYSASKAAADLATQSWAKSFSKIPVAIARSGNVIGGGDWANDRIIPDLVTAYTMNQLPTLRYPNSIRPWQHVLDCLNGYIVLINMMISKGISGEWNFGPSFDKKHTVVELVESFSALWGRPIGEQNWKPEIAERPHEAANLLLDSSKARNLLSWRDKLDFETAIKLTASWYKQSQSESPREVTITQIKEYLALN